MLGCNQSHANLQLQSAKRYPAVGLSLQVRCVLDTRQCANLPERVADKLFGLHWNLAGSQHLDPRDTKTIFDIYIYANYGKHRSLPAGLSHGWIKGHIGHTRARSTFFARAHHCLQHVGRGCVWNAVQECVDCSTEVCGLQHTIGASALQSACVDPQNEI